jgi:hypothetical protein
VFSSRRDLFPHPFLPTKCTLIDNSGEKDQTVCLGILNLLTDFPAEEALASGLKSMKVCEAELIRESE